MAIPEPHFGPILPGPFGPAERIASPCTGTIPRFNHKSRRLALGPSTVKVARHRHKTRAGRAGAAGTSTGDGSFLWSQATDPSQPYRPDRLTSGSRAIHNAGLGHLPFHSLGALDFRQKFPS
jgi:hypothetical protein